MSKPSDMTDNIIIEVEARTNVQTIDIEQIKKNVTKMLECRNQCKVNEINKKNRKEPPLKPCIVV